MQSRRKYNYLFIAILALLVAMCTTTSKTSRTNLATLYHPDKQFAQLDAVAFNTSDTTSDVYVKVNFNDLLYQKDLYSGQYRCSYRLSFILKKSYESAEIVSTGSLVYGDSVNYGKIASCTHSFQVPARYPDNYVLEIELYDLNRKASSWKYLNIWKSSRNGRQEFLAFDRNEDLLFRNYLSPGETFRLLTGLADVNTLTVSCYYRDFPVARPPYVEDKDKSFDYRPDSLFIIPVTEGRSEWMELRRQGFYHFRKDTTQRDGFTLFIFEDGYPELFSADQLREPLRYITTRKEYDSLMSAEQPKAAVDNFWLKTAGSEERARTLIQKYYTNVEESNRYFTSYIEGWKTDRGLIFTVLGKPNYVYRSDNSEEWLYGEPQNRNSLSFVFARVNNPFTDNDYMLLRTPTYKEPWFITVQSWRR